MNRRFFLIFIFVVVLLGLLLIVERRAFSATNISPNVSEHWAWNDLIGWINFYETNTVTVTSAQLSGYASSSIGDISLDCATTRGGDLCPLGQSDPYYYRVTNDGAGNLSGWGWNDLYGWISFDCANHATSGPCGISYRTYVDGSGNFRNYAWNDVVGWISFNCSDPNPPTGICGTSNYKVVTSWTVSSTTGYIDSTTYDTGVVAGAQINTFVWLGSKPVGTDARFQFAASNTTSTWNYIGPDGTSNTYYNPAPGVPMGLNYYLHSGYRYFRYRITLVSNQTQTETPRVDDVIINWSP